MRTTMYIKRVNLLKLDNASKTVNMHKDEIVSLLINRIIDEDEFIVQPYGAVRYQDSNADDEWITIHLNFDPVFYEKVQDLRRNYKFSVSWFVSFAIMNYLDILVKDLIDPEVRIIVLENNDRNHMYVASSYGNIQGFMTFLRMPEKEYLEALFTNLPDGWITIQATRDFLCRKE